MFIASRYLVTVRRAMSMLALRTRNIRIARRTVTKYREAMRILSSTQRRRIG